MRATVLTVFASLFAAPAFAESQSNLVTPVEWRMPIDVPLGDVQALVNQGFRVVDIEVEGTQPLTFCATLVENTGDYQKSWWWGHDLTQADVDQMRLVHGARLVDVEPYESGGGVLFAAVLVENDGDGEASAHGWEHDLTETALQDWLDAHPGDRVHDVQPYFVGGEQRYAILWVANEGDLESTWWIVTDVPSWQITIAATQNDARVIDFEPHDGQNTYSAILVPDDGQYGDWVHNITLEHAERIAENYASRPTDFERYETQGGYTRYALVMRRNDNDLTVATTLAMREDIIGLATAGFLLREYGPQTATLAGVHDDTAFEPASLMKTVHHFAAMREVALGHDELNAHVVENTGLNGSCPTGADPVVRELDDVLRDMMEQSSNTATQAIRSRYGDALIEATADAFGAPGAEINHTIGCFCNSTRNRVTLRELANLHEAAIDGALFPHLATFHDLMSNGSNFGRGAYSTTDVLDEELAASTLSADDQDAFRANMRYAHKGGSYTCWNGQNYRLYRSRGGYVRIPFRFGCGIVPHEYFFGAWVNEGNDADDASDAVGIAITMLYRDRLRIAIESWENAVCTPTTNFGIALPNSTGNAGSSYASGTTYLHRNDLTLRARGLPLNSVGFLLVAPSRGFAAFPGGSSGNLLLGGGIGRYQASVMSTGATGELSLTIDQSAIPVPTGPSPVLRSGDHLYFQWWHRDIDATGALTSNFTDGLDVTFV